MRVASLNAWGGARFDALAAWVPDLQADILCLQEVTRTPGLDGWTTFDDTERRLPQRANLFEDVRRLLPHHQAWFVASDSGPVASDAGGLHRQDFGLAVFVAEHVPVVAQLSRFVHGAHIDHDQWTTSDRPRIAQGLRVLDREHDQFISIVHVHGLRDPAGKHDTPARQAQAQRLAALLHDLRESSDLTVLCGDLNLLPDSATFDVLAERGLHDLVGLADTRTSLYTKPLRHASYLLISHAERVRDFQIPGTPEVSDHRPLVLTL